MFCLDNLTVIGVCHLKGCPFLKRVCRAKLWAHQLAFFFFFFYLFSSSYSKDIVHPGQTSIHVTPGRLERTRMSEL